MSDPLFDVFQIGISIHNFNKASEKRLGLSLVQWCVLKCLVDMPACSAHALAAAVGVHPSTLTQTLKRLEKKRFVFATEDPNDSRRKLISITRAGKETLDQASPRMADWSRSLGSVGKQLDAVGRAVGKALRESSVGPGQA